MNALRRCGEIIIKIKFHRKSLRVPLLIDYDSSTGVPKVWSSGQLNHTKSGTIVVNKCTIRWKNH